MVLQHAAGGMSQGMMQFLMLGLILVVFYFFLMRPQIKRQKELRKFQASLKRGDRVMVAGGIYGKVAEVAETYIMVEISPNTEIKVARGNVFADAESAASK